MLINFFRGLFMILNRLLVKIEQEFFPIGIFLSLVRRFINRAHVTCLRYSWVD